MARPWVAQGLPGYGGGWRGLDRGGKQYGADQLETCQQRSGTQRCGDAKKRAEEVDGETRADQHG